ncbi:N-acetylmuramoyl-L-alanine amidase [Maricaulis sp. W15]|uniref:N-acetylmuramoyl-L-alanine amidase n=1 Tax=Maricaulis sp. W15 TaxID=1772333 RepID=UPI000A534938|nr:N-acetylmuramoyl-L-alanine amidase [Maricaulis sp. W15]
MISNISPDVGLDVRAAPSPNFNDRKTAIRLIVLHYTGMENGAVAIERLCDRAAQVSAHYVIREDGVILQLVGEDKRAWHAGVASWQGKSDVNSASIGIEIVNGGHDFALPAYPAIQIDRLIRLLKDVMARHGLGPECVIGHSDVAPGRKQDPGEHFPWGLLVAAGCARATPPAGELVDDIAAGLERIGYGLEPGLDAVIEAFQRRWRPALVSGVADRETRGLIAALAGRS